MRSIGATLRAKDQAKIMDRYVTLAEAARLIGVSPKTLSNWKYLGRLSSKHGLRKVGRRVVFDLKELKEAVDRGDLTG